MLLGQLGSVFGGDIRERRNQRWLETQVSGLRAFIIDRDGGFDLAVFLPGAHEAEPPFSASEEWELRNEHVVPTINKAFMFTGCRRGVLIASSWTDPSLEDISDAFATLVAWADKPWQPANRWAAIDPEEYYRRRRRLIRDALLIAALAVAMLECGR